MGIVVAAVLWVGVTRRFRRARDWAVGLSSGREQVRKRNCEVINPLRPFLLASCLLQILLGPEKCEGLFFRKLISPSSRRELEIDSTSVRLEKSTRNNRNQTKRIYSNTS